MTQKYIYVPFTERHLWGATERRSGIRVGNHLAVTYTYGYTDRYSVYGLLSGRPIVHASFLDLEEAVRFGEWLHNLYGDYFDLWQQYPEWDIVVMTQWTIHDGLKVSGILKSLEEKSQKSGAVCLTDLNTLWHT